MLKCAICGIQVPRCPCCDSRWARCVDCGAAVHPRSTRCRQCAGKRIPRPMQVQKIDWPPVDHLEELVSVLGYRETGRRLGVSDNAVRENLRRRIQAREKAFPESVPDIPKTE